MARIPVAAIVGPTASGKTALAVELALRLNAEVVSADSMQIYKGMDIATAKPTAEEMRSVPHHLIGFLDPGEEFSVARYCELARPIIADINAGGKLPIIAGGTGLYIDSLLGNVMFAEAQPDPALREQLQRELDENGLDYMLDVLRSFDPDSADRLSAQRNSKRVLRAIEVYRTVGVTATQLNAEQISAPSPYRTVRIQLTADDREYLYERINLRVDRMIEQGLLDEARRFYEGCSSSTSSAAIGYKELLPYLRGELPLDTCVENLKRSTRRYAKRQLTWFNRDPNTYRFSIDRLGFEEIADRSQQIIEDFLHE